MEIINKDELVSAESEREMRKWRKGLKVRGRER
jgi:hypothetical protein